MDRIVELIREVNSAVNGVVWGVLMLILLVGAGIYLSVRTGSVQFRRFCLMLKETAGKIFQRGPRAEGDITPFQAPNVTMGGTMGVLARQFLRGKPYTPPPRMSGTSAGRALADR
ncbi:hypothetical protein GF402_01335 [Candidatus Fermentibacteria bacterium]|nr:hypothetical protein [Candidatus Fermentibacteria bacterium]